MSSIAGTREPGIQEIRSVDVSQFRIAVVIPLYNGAAFIEETLRSVFRQTRAPDEIVIVDDGSTDGGAEIAARIAGDRASILRQANGGQSSARNAGVAHTKANLIALLDQDDIWYPSHLQELADIFAVSPPSLGWAYSNVDQINASGDIIRPALLDTQGSTHPKRKIVHFVGDDMYILPSSSLIRRTAFDAVGGFDVRLSGTRMTICISDCFARATEMPTSRNL